MEKELRVQLLRSGGKKALKKYNDSKRATVALMNTGTRVHTDKRYRKPKHKNADLREAGNESMF